MQFADSRFLWLITAPAALLLLLVWRVSKRRLDLRRLRHRRINPIAERFGAIGDAPFWLCLILATASFVVALARPQTPYTAPRPAGIDIVILQDASASMRVPDVADLSAPAFAKADRWQRSMTFLRRLGDALSWREDRVAMAVFAHIATPQIRLTRDPNTFFFFLDHLHARPPFRLEDETTWDTNLEFAIDWGLRMIAKDEEVRGRSPNAKVFVLLSDGESWSGEVAKALQNARDRGVPLFVIGVGTLAGGRLPIVKAADGTPLALDGPSVSRLERASLQRIAAAGAGQYFELDRDPDGEIANAIVTAARRLAPPIAMPTGAEDLYWLFLAGGAALAALGFVFVRDRVELALLLAGAITAALVIPR